MNECGLIEYIMMSKIFGGIICGLIMLAYFLSRLDNGGKNG